ncbi:unnamed protein product [Cuscuta epithymum]|uniref:RNase H type-1 domain-containing protein n=1 Tax=Cuscuta epithymum TaxID=186058 RepID=A0AAV0F2F4_9ASTE|nr:unnamed protein product [Cuscuta epithymum]
MSGTNAEQKSIYPGIKQQRVPRIIKWQPPEAGTFKLNCDGSCRGSERDAGAGGVIRNHKGDWICGFLLNIGKTDSFQAELWGLRQGLLLARDLNLSRVMVEGDSESMIKVVRSTQTSHKTATGVLIRDCRRLLEDDRFILFQHTLWEDNKCADMLANAAHEATKGLSILEIALEWIKQTLWEDANGLEEIRF